MQEEQQLVSVRVHSSIPLRTKVDDIRAVEIQIEQLLQQLSLGETNKNAKVDGSLAGMKNLHALSHEKSLNFLCKTEEGTNTTENLDGKSKVHRFEIDPQTDLWSKPDPVGLGHIDSATAYMMQALYRVLCKRLISTSVKTVKVKNTETGYERGCMTSIGVRGISFQLALYIMYDFKSYIKEFGVEKLAEIIQNWHNEEYQQETKKKYPSIASNPEFDNEIKFFHRLFPKGDLLENINKACRLTSFIDQEAVSFMFVIHLLARVNDAKTDNIKLEIGHDESGELVLTPNDIDFDLADGNPLFLFLKTRFVKVAGEEKRQKVTEEHHYTGMKSILFTMSEVLDAPVHKNVKQDLTSEHAAFFILDWLELVYQYNCWAEQQIEAGHFTEKDLIEDDKPSMILLATFRSGMVTDLLTDLMSLQMMFTKGNVTHRELFQTLHKITAALYEFHEKNHQNPRDALRKIYGGESVEDAITQRDSNHPFTEELARCKIKKENNDDVKDATATQEIASFISVFDILSLPTPDEQLLFLEQVGRGFPFIKSLRLNETQRNDLLYEAVKQALPNATRLLISLGADVNQRQRLKKDEQPNPDKQHRDQPLLHALLENHEQHDYATRVLPTLQHLTNCSELDINLQNADGDTATMLFARIVDLGKYIIGKKDSEQTDSKARIGLQIFTELSSNGATLIPRNKFGQDAFEIAYDRWCNEQNASENPMDDVCFALLHKFRGQKLNTDIEFIKLLVDTYYDEPTNSDEVNNVINSAIHSLNEMSFKMSLDKISVAEDQQHPENWIRIEGAVSGVRYLNPDYAAILFNELGLIKNDDAYYGRRAINRILTDGNNGIFFKEEPELPGVEFGVFLFRKMLGNHGAAYSELFCFTDKNGEEYAVQLSSRLHGTVLQDDKMATHAGEQEQASKESLNAKRDEALKTLNKVDPHSFASMFISSAILNPEDDKPDNFILKMIYSALGEKAYLLSSFDNDHSMVDGYDAKTKKLMVKSIIFCLDQMKGALDKTFVNEFINMDVDQFIQTWLTELQTRYEQNNGLFKKSKRVFPTPFSQHTIDAIYSKMHAAQQSLRDNKQISAIDLLKILEPQVGVRYEDPLYKLNNPYSRFSDITEGLYTKDTKKKSFITQLTSNDILESQGIPASITVDPDEASKFTPAQALKYHKMLCSRDLIMKQIFEEFKQGNTRNFDRIEFDSIRKYIINNCDFSQFEEKAQLAILKSLCKKDKPIKFSRLIIKNSTALTDKIFADILKNCGHLIQINLSGCSNISSTTIETIDKSALCSTLDHLVLNNTNIRSIEISQLTKLRKVLASNCNNLSAVDIGCQALNHIVLKNNRQLKTLSVNSRRLRTIDVRGCSALSDESVSCIVSSSTLENLKLDERHLRTKKRYLTVQAAKQKQWNEKVLKLIIDQGELDLSAINLTADDLMEIAEQAKSKNVPQITRLKLNATNVPAAAIRRFIAEHPTCVRVYVNHKVHRNTDIHFKKTEHFDSIKKPFTLEVLATGQVARFSEPTSLRDKPMLFVDDCTLLRQDRAIQCGQKISAMLQMHNSDWLVVTDKEIQLRNGITGKQISSIDLKQSVTRRFRSRMLGLKNSEASLHQLSDQFALLSLTDNKSAETKLYVANTLTNLLRPIKLPKGFSTDCHFAVLSSTEVAMASSNSLIFFNPHHRNKNITPVYFERTTRQIRKIDNTHLLVVHDDGVSIVDLQNKKSKPKFLPLGHDYNFKDAVMMPSKYAVLYDDQNAAILDLNNLDNGLQKVDLPAHEGIKNIVVDVYGKLHCSLDMQKGCAVHTVSMTDETVDLAVLRELLAETDVLPFQNKLCLSASFIADPNKRNQVIKYFEILFGVEIKPITINHRHCLELASAENCSVKDMRVFIMALNPKVEQLEQAGVEKEQQDGKKLDMSGMLIDENDLRYLARNTSDIGELINLEPSTLTTTTLRYLLTEHKQLTHINCSTRSSQFRRGTFQRGSGDASNRQSLRLIKIVTPDGRDVVVENVPGKNYQALCSMVLQLPGYELDDYIPPVQLSSIKTQSIRPQKALPVPEQRSEGSPIAPPRRQAESVQSSPLAIKRGWKKVTTPTGSARNSGESSPIKALPKMPPLTPQKQTGRGLTSSPTATRQPSPAVVQRRPTKALPVPPPEDDEAPPAVPPKRAPVYSAPMNRGQQGSPVPAKRGPVKHKNAGFWKGPKGRQHPNVPPKTAPKAPPRGQWRRPMKRTDQEDGNNLGPGGSGNNK